MKFRITIMHNIEQLETYFHTFISNITTYLPEDIFLVDLKFLYHNDLLHYYDPKCNDKKLTRYFHVIESSEKITLFNQEFVIWIVPEKIENLTMTYTLIALYEEGKEPKLQLCFVTSGIYNCSRLVLRVLEKLLFDIQENEDCLRKLEENHD